MSKMANEKRLIDANALLGKIKCVSADVCANYGEGFCQHGYTAPLVRLMIKEMPTVDAAEVVHGKWIGEVGGYMWRQNCSVCNGPVYNKMKPYYNYCPYCGADMRGETE